MLPNYGVRICFGLVVVWAVGIAGSSRANAQVVGQPIPAWKSGELMIHHISTGRGNATFVLLPDGTTLLIDAGAISPIDWRTKQPRTLPIHPDTTRQPGEWIARYVRRCLAFQSDPRLNYVLLTHLHDDHIGSPVLAPKHKSGQYALSGITELADHIPIGTILDRGWPDYSYPRPLDADSLVLNYRRFLAYQTQQKSLSVAQLRAGRADQITLIHQANRYKNQVEVRTVLANGNLWTGQGQATRPLFPDLASISPAQYPTENMCSLGVRIQYGNFSYFSGGDIPGVLRFGEPAWHDVETPLAAVLGPISVMLMDHHGYDDAQNETLLAATRPQVLVVPAWHDSHPDTGVLERVLSPETYAGERIVFATSLPDAALKRLGKLSNQPQNTAGHVVIRVRPGGNLYQVLVLDDTDELARIKAIHGPYRTR